METEEKKKLTDTQLRIIQAVAGIISSAVLIISIWLPGYLNSNVSQNNVSQDSLLNYLFIAVFVIILFGRRKIESTYKLRLNFYNLILIDGILTGILIYVIVIFSDTNSKIQLSSIEKILICIGIALVIAVLGGIIPYLRYLKRKKDDKLIPIRIPEKTAEEVEKEKETARQASARNSVSSKINEMTKDLGNSSMGTDSPSNSLERRIADMTKDLGERDANTENTDGSNNEAMDEPVDSAVDNETDDEQ